MNRKTESKRANERKKEWRKEKKNENLTDP